MEATNPRMVVASATIVHDKHGKSFMLVGARHWDSVMRATYEMLLETGFEHDRRNCKDQQGFIDQYGVFMDRKEAWLVAKASNQIRTVLPCQACPEPELYSESLY